MAVEGGHRGPVTRSGRFDGNLPLEAGAAFFHDGWAFVEFGVLGPLQVNGRDVMLAGKARVVLAALLLHANQVVPVDALVDALWDDAPPASARTTLQGYVKRLRQLPGTAVAERIITRSPGYLIQVRSGELDLTSFTGLSDQGRAAARAGDWERASALLADALALWRGQPLGDVPSEVLQRTEVQRLAELRMQAVEAQVEAELRLGRMASCPGVAAADQPGAVAGGAARAADAGVVPVRTAGRGAGGVSRRRPAPAR